MLLVVLALWQTFPASAQDDLPPYESYYLYVGDYPAGEENGWSEKAQGLTHDDHNWYITKEWGLWKIPDDVDIGSVDEPGGDVLGIDLDDVEGLEGWAHAGDLSYFEYGGTGFLLVPLEKGPGPGLAIMRSADLGLVGAELLPETDAAGFAAVDQQGVVYTANEEDVDRLLAYTIDWNLLSTSGELVAERAAGSDILLRNPDGQTMYLERLQGADFSDGGEVLYISCGNAEEYNASNDGIHAFDVATGIQLAHSANGGHPFNFKYDPGSPKWEEPEGLTVWDLDDGRVEHIRGQLHVLLLQNQKFVHDDVDLKHYAHTIYVDGTYSDEEYGRRWDPFSTVAEAHDYAWGGSRIAIRGGRYPEALSLAKRVLLHPFEGTVTVGVGGMVRILPGGTVRLSDRGRVELR
jgi:hypothetical protein